MSIDSNIHIVDQLDRGLSYGESCFETFRVVNDSVFLWQRHWLRLQAGLLSFGVILKDDQQDMVHQCCLDAAKKVAHDCLLRLTVSGGNAEWGLQKSATPQVFIQVIGFSEPPRSAELKCVEYPFSLLPRPAKYTSDYALTLRAIHTWNLEKACSALVCKKGFIISGITANIALLSNGKWLTPAGDGVLQGTIRQFFIDHQAIVATPCTTEILAHVEAAVFMNAGLYIQPIHKIEGRPLNINHPAINKLEQLLQQNGAFK